MIVVPAVEAQLRAYKHDPGAFLNFGMSAVITSLPTMPQLRALWRQFLEEHRTNLHFLLSTPHDEVVQQFGLLGYNRKNSDQRGANLWGLAPKNYAEATGLARVKQAATLKAIVESGLLTEAECGLSKFKRNEGSAAFLNGLPKAEQERFFNALLQPGCDLDAIIRFNQGSALGLDRIEESLQRAPSTEAFLQTLAVEAAENARLPLAWSEGRPCKWYAPIWFAGFLAREGVWLLPLHHARHATASYPVWMRPIQVWMSLPQDMREFGQSLMRDHLARKQQRANDALVVRIAIELAWTSNVWRMGCLCAGPLIGYKEHALSNDGNSPSQRSWAVNRLWEAQSEHFGAPADQHPDGHAFVQAKRLVTKGRRPFNWVHSPHRRNLARYIRLYGDPPPAFPQWLVDWADELERLLPLFDVEAIEQKIGSLDLWLLYLAGLSQPPKSFEQVVRHKHINSAGAPGGICFRQFLVENFSESNTNAQRAMATLKQAWALAAVQNGFVHRLANPIDLSDAPYRPKPRGARTVRSALDHRAAEVIARENMRGDMKFAREVWTEKRPCWRTVRSPETNELIEVFFPAAPTLIHVILHSGMRGKQARWLDSGEGDENEIDFDVITERPNPRPTAQKGRREGFLRVCNVMGDTRSRVVGMWVNSGKSGPHEVPWVHEDLVEPVRALQAFQSNFYPLRKPVPIVEADFEEEYRKKKGDSFPLARDPANRLGRPLSAEKLRGYWAALLAYCQPIVDQELGYHYPLIFADGAPRYDIHSLRVTIVTTLLEHGVPASVIQKLVGHKSLIMTWYYQDVTNYQVHSALQAAIEQQKTIIKDPSKLSEENAERLASTVITFRSEADFIGADMLHEHRRMGGGIDVFSHGICPGGNCETGGERLAEGRYKPVWRPRACSGCRFRVTGPAFLNGLVQRANELMWEIKGSIRKEADLNLQIEEEEDAGRSAAHLRSSIGKEQVFRDLLFNEWCLELRTVHRAVELFRDGRGATENALVAGHDLANATACWRETHEFELAQRLVHDSTIVQGSLDLPADVLSYRDQVLLKIAYANDLAGYFYSLDKRTARRALDLFGELLITHTDSADQLQELIDGAKLLEDVPKLAESLSEKLIPAGPDRRSSPGLAA